MQNRLPIFLLGSVTLLVFGLRAEPPPVPPTPGQSNFHPFAAKFQTLVDDHQMAGAVFLVATKDKILDEETVGYADLETRKPMTADAEFWIASMTKPMTGAALMMLVDEGKVNIDDPVEKYLPEFQGQKVQGANAGPAVPANHPILVREILSHTSGLSSKAHLDVSLSLEEQVREIAGDLLDHQPGTKYSYANAGIATVGRIVEVSSGMPYEQFMQERIFTPLGMKNTAFWPDAGQVARLALAYKPTANGGPLAKMDTPGAPVDEAHRRHFPGGGLFSTADDVLKFSRMMLGRGVYDGKRYLSDASFTAMTTRRTTEATGGSYGLTLDLTPHGFAHGGAFGTLMKILPRAGLVEIFLVQQLGAPNAPDLQDIFARTANSAFDRGGQ